MKQAVDALLEVKRSEGLGEGTIETAEYRLWHFFGLPTNANRPLRWLLRRGEELYAAARVQRSPDTHQAELALAKQLGALCVKRRWLRENPFDQVAPVGRKTHGSTKPRFRIDESRKLRDYCHSNASDQWCVLTLGYLLLGARASEMVRREKRDLDDGGRLLWIDRTKTRAGSRRLVIPDELQPLLLELVRGKRADDPIFTKEDGSKATRHGAYHHVRRVYKAAGVPVLSPQALRRTASDVATDAGELGPTIARHLGQVSEVVTNRSYRNRNVVTDARNQRVLQVIAGGRS